MYITLKELTTQVNERLNMGDTTFTYLYNIVNDNDIPPSGVIFTKGRGRKKMLYDVNVLLKTILEQLSDLKQKASSRQLVLEESAYLLNKIVNPNKEKIVFNKVLIFDFELQYIQQPTFKMVAKYNSKKIVVMDNVNKTFPYADELIMQKKAKALYSLLKNGGMVPFDKVDDRIINDWMDRNALLEMMDENITKSFTKIE